MDVPGLLPENSILQHTEVPNAAEQLLLVPVDYPSNLDVASFFQIEARNKPNIRSNVPLYCTQCNTAVVKNKKGHMERHHAEVWHEYLKTRPEAQVLENPFDVEKKNKKSRKRRPPLALEQQMPLDALYGLTAIMPMAGGVLTDMGMQMAQEPIISTEELVIRFILSSGYVYEVCVVTNSVGFEIIDNIFFQEICLRAGYQPKSKEELIMLAQIFLVQYIMPVDQQTIKETFELFEKQPGVGVEVSLLGTVVRVLGAYPSEEYLQQIASTIKTKTFTLEFLTQAVEQINKEQSMSEDDLMKAMKIFDPTGTGYIARDKMKQILTEMGDKMAEQDVNVILDFMSKLSDDPNKIPYQKYVASDIFEVLLFRPYTRVIRSSEGLKDS